MVILQALADWDGQVSESRDLFEEFGVRFELNIKQSFSGIQPELLVVMQRRFK